MSTKTIFKRIALTAVSALAAGTLSVVVAPTANAAAADGGIDDTTGTIGLVGAITPTLASQDNSTTRTAVLMSTGTLVLSLANTGTVNVSAGARITGQSGGASNINGSQTCAVAATSETVSITPTGAAGTTFTVTTYAEDTCATAATIRDVITVTIAATNLAGTPSATESVVRWDSNVTGAPTAAEDAANASVATGTTLKLYVAVKDVYGQAVSSAGGALIVTASAGAVLGSIAASSAPAPASVLSTQVLTTDPSAVWVQIGELTAGAGWNGTVTVSYNGVVLATKTGKITGAVTKLEGSALAVGSNANSGATPNAFAYQAYDAAGNVVVVTETAVTLTSSSVATLVTGAVGTTANTSTSAGLGSVTCAQGASFNGTTNLIIQTVLSNGTVIKSAPFAFSCGGNATSYTASWDKATYSQGDIATLTVQFRDARGAVANSVGTITASSADGAISANQMERVTALPGNSATADAKGQRKFTFTVGTSAGIVAGKYNAVISFPEVNTRGTNAGVATGNASAAYEIVAPASISNAEVLASIVKLIAAINKQIRQLQKQLRR